MNRDWQEETLNRDPTSEQTLTKEINRNWQKRMNRDLQKKSIFYVYICIYICMLFFNSLCIYIHPWSKNLHRTQSVTEVCEIDDMCRCLAQVSFRTSGGPILLSIETHRLCQQQGGREIFFPYKNHPARPTEFYWESGLVRTIQPSPFPRSILLLLLYKK